MIHKTFTLGKGGVRMRVTFSVPSGIWADKIELALATPDKLIVQPLELQPSGDWSLSLDLPTGQVYQFQYMCDDQQAMGDAHADGYGRSPHDGSLVCLLDTGTITSPDIEKAAINQSALVAIHAATATGEHR